MTRAARLAVTVVLAASSLTAVILMNVGSAVALPTPVTVVQSLNNPYGTAMDSSGNLYISNNAAGTVSVMPKSSGTLFGVTVTADTLATIATGLNQPNGLAFDSAGNLYIANGGTGSVSVLPAVSGMLFGVPVTANTLATVIGGMLQPTGLVFDSSGNLYISDAFISTIYVLPATTSTIFGVVDPADALATVSALVPLNSPTGLAFDSAGNLYIANSNADSVMVIPATTTTIFGVAVTANTVTAIASATVNSGGSLNTPTGIAFDSSGNLYIADNAADSVFVLPRSAGTLFGVSVTANTVTTVLSGGPLSTPTGLALDSSGSLYISDGGAQAVFVLPRSSGTFFGAVVNINTLAIVASGAINPEGVAVDSAGNIYFANGGNNTVMVLPKASGTLFGVSVTANVPTPIITSGLSDPIGLAFDSAGDLYVANLASETVSVLPAVSGTLFGMPVTANSLSTIVSSGLSNPEGVAVDSLGNLYISNAGGNTISVLPRTTGTLFGVLVVANTETTLATGLHTPIGLAFDSVGNLYIVNNGNGTISVLPKTSSTLFGVAVTANSIATVVPGLTAPIDLTFDASGNLYFSNNTANVSVLPLVAGTIFGVPVTANTVTPVDLGLSNPNGLAFDASGDLYWANGGANTVSELLSHQNIVIAPPYVPTTTTPTTIPVPPPTTSPTTAPTSTTVPSPPQPIGYIVTNSMGGVKTFGSVTNEGSLPGRGITPAAPIVGNGVTSDAGGYWMVGSDGGVFAFGDAGYFGSLAGTMKNKPIEDLAGTSNNGGYWLVGADGGVFSFGDAGFFGSCPMIGSGCQNLAAPIVAIAPTPDGGGYWLVGADGGVFSFGDAVFYGSNGGRVSSSPTVSIASSHDGGGYWIVTTNGMVSAFGDAPHFIGTPNIRLNSPIFSLVPTPDGGGYWLMGADGGVFAYGDAPYDGSGV